MPVEIENNDTLATANSESLGTTITGNSVSKSDIDYYQFTLTAVNTLNINFTAPTGSDSIGNPHTITVYDALGNIVATWAATVSSAYKYLVDTAGIYYVSVGNSYSTGQYALNLTTTSGNFESEFNGNRATADPATLGTTISGQVKNSSDVDYFSLA